MGGTTAGARGLRKEKARSKGILSFPEVWVRKSVVIKADKWSRTQD